MPSSAIWCGRLALRAARVSDNKGEPCLFSCAAYIPNHVAKGKKAAWCERRVCGIQRAVTRLYVQVKFSDLIHACWKMGALEPGLFRPVITKLEQWVEAAELKPKHVVNCLPGVFLRGRHYRYQCIPSTSKLDLAHLA